jgi:hypothetical protein
LGTAIIRGRTFDADEMAGRRPAMIINQAAARALWGADSPLTTPVRIDTTIIDVVGIVADARYGDVERPAEPAVFFPHRGSRGVIFLRTTGDPSALALAARAAIRRAGAGHATSGALYAAAVLLLVLAMCAAAALPTMRTMRTDPRDAMRTAD